MLYSRMCVCLFSEDIRVRWVCGSACTGACYTQMCVLYSRRYLCYTHVGTCVVLTFVCACLLTEDIYVHLVYGTACMGACYTHVCMLCARTCVCCYLVRIYTCSLRVCNYNHMCVLYSNDTIQQILQQNDIRQQIIQQNDTLEQIIQQSDHAPSSSSTSSPILTQSGFPK